MAACDSVIVVQGPLHVTGAPIQPAASPQVSDAPSLLITAPAPGSRLSDRVIFTYTVARFDLRQVSAWRLTFRRQSQPMEEGLVNLPVSLVWDTTKHPNGEYAVQLEALNATGQVLVSSQAVNYTLHGGGTGAAGGGGGGGGGGAPAVSTNVAVNNGTVGATFGGP